MSVNEKKEFTPTIVAFCCNWCSYAGADLAGTNRLNYPADVKIIRVPCSCRVNPMFILRAFQRGADGVILCGCHPGDCHYTTGNYYARRRIERIMKCFVTAAPLAKEYVLTERSPMLRKNSVCPTEQRKFVA